MKIYPDTPLKKQVRDYSQTQSAVSVIVAAFVAAKGVE
jgi:hypothetical protein